MAPERLRKPSKMSMRPTENSIARAVRGGIAMPKKMTALPTMAMVGERDSFAEEDADEFGGGMGEAGATARNEIDVTRNVELADLHFLHPAVLDFPAHAHARDDGHAHAHLHEAFDAFDGGHFDGHVEGSTVAGEEFNDAAAKGRFDTVGDEGFGSEV